MRTVRYHSYGHPEQVLQLAAVAAPPAPGKDEVQVRVLARPIHPGDLLGVAGRYRAAGDTSGVASGGVTPGFEGMGVIEAVGSAVGEHLRPGMRVAFFPGRGAWGELANVGAAFVMALPDDVSDPLAAQMHVIPLTALMLLRAARAAGAVAGSTMMLTAAGSAVARIAAALALREGIRVVGVVRASAGIADLKQLLPGAQLLATDQPDWRAQLDATLAGAPVHTLLDPVGGALASELFLRIASGGTLLSYGDLSGEPLTLPALAFSTRDIQIRGVSVGRWVSQGPEQRGEDLRDVLALLRSHAELLPVAAQYDLADVHSAVSHATRPGKLGGVILTSALEAG